MSLDTETIGDLLIEGADAIKRARAVCAISRALNASRIALQVAGRERRGMPCLHGGRDLDEQYIADLITRAWLCTACIAFRVGIPRTKVEASLTAYGHTLVVTNRIGRCDACLKETVVHRLG